MRALSRLLKGALYLLFVLLILYLVGANGLLNSPRFKQQINKQPEKFSVDWDLAVTPFPGLFWARGFNFTSQTIRVQSHTRFDTLYGIIDPLVLPERIVRSWWIKGAGVELALRPRPREGRPFQSLYDDFPPIPGLKVGSEDGIVDPATYQ